MTSGPGWSWSTCEGQTLADEISAEGRLSPQRVADIGAQLAGALARAHERRIVHRDIKPANVLIDKDGRPKISDFGIARRHDDDQLTQIGFVTGTPGYLSPELARGGDPDSASDVWALGATLYAAVEGQSPYAPRSNPIALLQAIATEPPRPMTHAGALGPAIEAMMHGDPARRWDMATSAQQLAGIAGDDATGATVVMPTVDPAATQVIAAPPVDPTRRLEAAARGPVAAVGSEAGRPETAGSPGRRRLPLVFVALLAAAALGVVYLFSQVGDQGGTPPRWERRSRPPRPREARRTPRRPPPPAKYPQLPAKYPQLPANHHGRARPGRRQEAREIRGVVLLRSHRRHRPHLAAS